jgi:phosphatidylserine decarboxylase
LDIRPLFTLPGIPRKTITRLGGWVARRRIPRSLRKPLWSWLTRRLGIDPTDVPGVWEDYPHFLSLFTRPLPPNSRPLPQEEGWLAPADGRLLSITPATPEQSWVIKGTPYSTHELLPGGDAQMLSDLVAYQIYLAPANYHRYHAPCSLRILRAVVEPGDLQPVDPQLVKRSMRVLQTNRRILLHCLTENENPFAILLVGALNVGAMRFVFDETLGVPPLTRGQRHYDPPHKLSAGEELGWFEFGSTVVLFAPKEWECVVEENEPTRARELLLQKNLPKPSPKEVVKEW